MNKSTGHPELETLALSEKAKKEKQTRRFANQAFAWCHLAVDKPQLELLYEARGEKCEKTELMT